MLDYIARQNCLLKAVHIYIASIKLSSMIWWDFVMIQLFQVTHASQEGSIDLWISSSCDLIKLNIGLTQ